MVVKGSYEDFLYILAGLAWLAFSIYKGSQKNKKSRAPDSQSDKKGSGFEKVLEELLGVKDKDIVYDQQYINEPKDNLFNEVKENEEKVIEAAPEVFSYEKAYDEDNFLPKKEVYTSALHKKDNLKVKKDLTVARKKKKPKFDVRKAVIYSEILNRPTY